MCLDYHNEEKFVLKFKKKLPFEEEKVLHFSGFDPGTFRSQVDNTAPRPRSQ